MKRFYSQVAVEAAEGGFQITLDGRKLRTQGGSEQIVPTSALVQKLAAEWQAQGEKIDPRSLPRRDLADFAIDSIAADPAPHITKLLAFAQTDTLCYRADPDAAAYRQQHELWEPIVTACEAREGVRFERVCGIMPRAQSEATLAALRLRLERESAFTLAAALTMASLAASLITALAALEEGADAAALFGAANAEEDWQAELWGWDDDAIESRATRLAAFVLAAEFARLARV